MQIINYLKCARIHAVFISVLLIITSFLYARHKYKYVDIVGFSVVGASILFFHLAANAISEYRDFEMGIDEINKSVQSCRLKASSIPPRHILCIGLASFAVASFLGVSALFIVSKNLVYPGIVGAFLSIFYSEWPFGYKYKALGEIGVFVAFGPLLVFSCVYSGVGKFEIDDLLFSIPMGLLTTCVLLANNIRDIEYDRVKIRTFATVFGKRVAYALLFFMSHGAFLTIPVLVFNGAIPKGSFITFLAYPIIGVSMRYIDTPRFIDVFGILHVVFHVLLSVSFMIF